MLKALWDRLLFRPMRLSKAGGRLLKPDESAVGFDDGTGLAALRTFRRFVTDGGMRPIDAGPLSRARQIEGMQFGVAIDHATPLLEFSSAGGG